MSARTIWRCWAALLLLLATTTAMAFVPLGTANLFISLTIAVIKAGLVLVFFMELKRSSGLVRVFAAAGFFWLMILIALTAADYTHRTDQRTPLDQVS
ncbi:MAG TPA: cytochrome C oxidase subunit IV family protein [Sphingomicrobium sp.]|nr:cytochrome C oxidase subunit IV family protein [Sphingomicrobium sp.]